MNEAIEFHDSDIDAITEQSGEILVWFSPAYIHRSAGRPGIDAGSGWLQRASLIFREGQVLARPHFLPQTMWNGSLQVNQAPFSNLIPADGIIEGDVLFRATFQSGELLTVRGQGLRIQRHGEPKFVENYDAGL